jgi:hypothetical protein
MIAILFSCTFALAAEGYKIHHQMSSMTHEEQNEIHSRVHIGCSYFTQMLLYNFIHQGVKLISGNE